MVSSSPRYILDQAFMEQVDNSTLDNNTNSSSTSKYLVEVLERIADGSATSRRLRKSGRIPSVVYAHGECSWPMSVNERAFLKLAEKATSSQVFILKSERSGLNDRPAIVKEIQIDRLRNKVLHIDFQALKENEEIVIQVPLKFTGESTGVKEDGGILSIAAHTLSVLCLPREIPTSIDVLVTALKIGDSIHAKELTLPKGVRLAGKEDETIVSVIIVKQVVEAVTTTAVAADSTDVAAADGAAPAAADAAGKAAGADAGKPAAGKAAAGKDAPKGKK